MVIRQVPASPGRPVMKDCALFAQQPQDAMQQLLDHHRQQAEEAKRAAADARTESEKRAKLDRRRARQDGRHAWAAGVAQALAIVCVLLASVMLLALVQPPDAARPNEGRRAWRPVQGGSWSACWASGNAKGGSCEAWQRVYTASALLGFALEMLAALLCVGVAMGWTAGLHTALLAFLAGTWAAATSALAMTWLTASSSLAIFASVCLGLYMLLAALALPTVALLPLVWVWRGREAVGRLRCRRGRAGSSGSSKEEPLLAGADPSSARELHWATAAYAGSGGGLRGALYGTLFRLFAATEEDLDPPGAPSPLFIAAARGHTKATRLLLSLGADPDAVFYSAAGNGPFRGLNFPLRAAAAAGHVGVVRELLRFEADPNLVDSGSGRGAQHEAAAAGHARVAQLLLSCGAGASTPAANGRSPLHEAAAGGHAAVVAALLRAGADPGVVDAQAATALHLAAARGHRAAVGELLRCTTIDPNATDSAGRTALWRAAAAGHGLVVEQLLAADADPDRPAGEGRQSPLLAAAAAGHGGVAALLLRGGANMDLADAEGFTPLLAAVAGQHSGVAQLLIAAGADVNVASCEETSPLAAAVVAGNAALVDTLLAAGARTDCPDARGRYPLHLAVVGGHTGIAEALLLHGADPRMADSDGSTALHVAAAAGGLEMIRVFRSMSGAGEPLDPALPDRWGATPQQVAQEGGWSAVAAELLNWEVQLAMCGGPAQSRATPRRSPTRSQGRRTPSPAKLPPGVIDKVRAAVAAGLEGEAEAVEECFEGSPLIAAVPSNSGSGSASDSSGVVDEDERRVLRAWHTAGSKRQIALEEGAMAKQPAGKAGRTPTPGRAATPSRRAGRVESGVRAGGSPLALDMV